MTLGDARPEPVTAEAEEDPSALFLSRQGQALEDAVLANLGAAERHGGTAESKPVLANLGAAERHGSRAESKPESDRDMVVWLHQRMTHLQHERESRWQKILKLLPGLS